MDPAGLAISSLPVGCSSPQADVLQSVFLEYPTVARDPKAGSIKLIPIANKPKSPW
jgi:hypothetical protein